MADQLNGIFISELLADNAGGQAIDTDGDGNTNKSDEFIELQSTNGSPMSLDGYQIWSEKEGLLYSFGATDVIGPGGNATLVGNYTGTPPADFYSAGISEGTNFIPDGEGQKWDNIYLVDTNTGDYVTLSYGNPPRPLTPPPGFTGTTQIGSGEAISSTAPNGTAFARNANGDLIETTPNPGAPNTPCFAKGTLIDTSVGAIAVEDLKPGQKIKTLDHGIQPLLAIGASHLTRLDLLRNPQLRPVQVTSEGKTLTVSPCHRIVVADPYFQLLFGQDECLVSAGHLASAHVEPDAPPLVAITYYHLLFAEHEIIWANGVLSESLFSGQLLQQGLDGGPEWQIVPNLDLGGITHAACARPVLRRFEASIATKASAVGLTSGLKNRAA